MNYLDAIDEILARAGNIKLPHHKFEVVTIARREFANGGSCDARFITPIESVLKDCLRKWTIDMPPFFWPGLFLPALTWSAKCT